MRHRKAGRKLNRNATHRLALMRNLSRSLIIHERIITTVEKAKEARRFVEKLITTAKENTLHARRQAIAKLGPTANTEIFNDDEEPTGETILERLFNKIGPRFQDRPGGYTRVIKRHERRLGDGGKTAFLELLKEGETKVRAKAPTPQAPRVQPIPAAPSPAPETPPAESAPPPVVESSAAPEEKPAQS